MPFDINTTTAQMLQAMEEATQNDWSKIKDNAADFMEEHKDRMQTLATQRLNNEIDDDFLQARLGDEKDILETELVAGNIIDKATIENAANAAIDLLSQAITAALGSVL